MIPSSDGPRHTRLGTLQWILAVLGTLYCLVVIAELIAWDANRLPNAGTIGAEQAQLTTDPGYARGFVRVTDVAPGSPLARAGVTSGDRLQFIPTYDYLRYRRAGERVRAIVDHDGRRRAIDITATPRIGPADLAAVRFDLGNLIPALFGAFIVLRSRRNKAAALLGGMLVAFGLPSISAQMWEGGRPMFTLLSTIDRAYIASVGVFMLAFAMYFLSQRSSAVTRRQWYAFAGYVALTIVTVAIWSYCSYVVTTLPFVGDGNMLFSAVGMIAYVASLVYLVLAWRASITLERERSALLLLGVAAMIVSQIISLVVFLWMAQAFTANSPLLSIAELLSGIIAPVCLTYAILKHRVLDLGFVLNRTIVYATVSAILLIAFGLVEWAVDHLVTIQGREKNALVDAAIALAVYLTFHRVRDATEHAIESLFFRRWKEAESKLRRFVAQAPHITTPDALVAAFGEAASRFTDGARVVLYVRDEGGHYVPASTPPEGLPQIIDENDAILIDLRTDPKPLALDTVSPTLGASYAIPMVHRHVVTGVALLGVKPSGAAFRPDEIATISWAVQQIGLDLQTLAVDRLEGVMRSQAQQIEVLRARDELYQRLKPAVRRT